MIEKLKAALNLLDAQWQLSLPWSLKEVQDVAEGLRSVIAEMEAAQPVAWRYHSVSPFADKDGMCKVSDKWNLIHKPDQRDAHSAMCGMEAEPLYTHPQPKAEPAQEPVAYRWKYKFEGNVETGAYEYHSKDFAVLVDALGGEPLYTHPYPKPKEETVQEPVAWEYRYKESNPHTVNYGKWGEWERLVPRNALETVEGRVAEMKQYIATGYTYEIRALYDSPQQKQEPLTNKEITEAWISVSFPTKPDTYFELTNQVRNFARAIETKHGIK